MGVETLVIVPRCSESDPNPMDQSADPLLIKPTSHLIQAPDINTSAWWRSTPPLSHQFTVKVVASTIKAILFVASLF